MSFESTRRRLTPKQADTVDRLCESAVQVLRQEDFAGLTVRAVASRAGVGPATAYTYFSSKEHLVAEVFWRRLSQSPRPESDGLDRTGRVVAVLRGIALLLADEPGLSSAASKRRWGSPPIPNFSRPSTSCTPERCSGPASGTAPTKTSPVSWSVPPQ